jgi:hypothetical protein
VKHYREKTLEYQKQYDDTKNDLRAERLRTFRLYWTTIYFIDKNLLELTSDGSGKIPDAGDSLSRTTLKCPDPFYNVLSSVLCTKREISDQFLKNKLSSEIHQMCKETPYHDRLCTHMNYFPFHCTRERMDLLNKCKFSENMKYDDIWSNREREKAFEFSVCLMENEEPYNTCLKSFFGDLLKNSIH